jgi:ABC-type Mn2+/Zn2+ transport system ATPase subunit
MNSHPVLPQNDVLAFEDVSVSYNHHPALSDLSLVIPHGKRVAVVGPNGAGKSTLFKAMVGLLPLRSGNILVHGVSIENRQAEIVYLPQREEVDLHIPLTVFDVVLMGRYSRLGWQKKPGKDDISLVWQCMQQMGISDLAKRSIGDLSGGQQQRVFLARALAQKPHIFLLDEPFNGVDAATQESTFLLLDHLRSQQVTVLVSTHDLNMAAHRFDLAIILNRRLVAFGPPKDVFTPDTIRNGFGDHTLVMDGWVAVEDCCPPAHTSGRQE